MPSCRVLVVDDEKRVRQAWARTLKLAGHTVRTAGTAEDALQECEEHSFDVLVLDFLIPSMSGIELLARIRKVQPLVRAIIISGKIDRESNEDEISAGLKESVECDVYLHKPVAGERLRKAVSDLVSEAPENNWRRIAKQVRIKQQVRICKAKEVAKGLRRKKKKKKK